VIQNDAPCTLEKPISVKVSLDNGVTYEGLAFEVQAKSDNFPDGLVMVRSGNTDFGVPVSYISKGKVA
jgi:hypothetical protein